MKYLTLLLPLLLPIVSLAQQSSSQAIPLPIWKAPVPDKQGAYVVSINSICSVALERYDLEYKGKTYPIVECSIETVGGKTARFYYIDDREDSKKDENDSLLKPLKESIKGVLPEDEEKKREKLRVVKTYPESVLAASVEYRLGTEREILDLYQGLRDAWVATAP
jgi:hypothetical protein